MSNVSKIDKNLDKNLSIYCPSYFYLSPILSENTIKVHFEQHHLKYYEFLQSKKITTLDEALASRNNKIINFAMQLIYHNLFWKSLSLNFSLEQFQEIYPNVKEDYLNVLGESFGSGWIILTKELDQFKWIFISNAQTFPISKILLIFDLWEHAYYLQYYATKSEYFLSLLSLANLEYLKSRL